MRHRRPHFGAFALLMAFAFISHFNRVSIATAGDSRLMDQYQISPTRMGMVYSSFLLAYTICMIPGGMFIDRFGPRAALMLVGIGSAVFAGMTGLVGLTVQAGFTVYLLLLVVRGLMGIVSSPLHPACAAAVGQLAPPGIRSWINGLVTGAALVGVAVTPVVFGGMIERLTWPVAFLVAAAVTAGIALIWSLLIPSTRPVEAKPSIGRMTWRELLTHRSLLLLTLSYGAIGYFQYLFFYWMNYYFKTVLSYDETASRYYAAIPPLAMAIGMPAGGWLSDLVERTYGTKHGRRIVPMCGMLAGAVFLFLGIMGSGPVWIVTWFSLAMGVVGMAEGPFWLTATELGRERSGSSAAIVNTGGNAGGMLAPVVTPWVGETFGWGYAIGLGALICLGGVAMWLGVRLGQDAQEQPEKRAAYSPEGK